MNHQITICTSRRHRGAERRPGHELTERLRHAIGLAGDAVPERFAVSGVSCMAGCDHPCTVACHRRRNAAYLFRDIETDSKDLLAFARAFDEKPDTQRFAKRTRHIGVARASPVSDGSAQDQTALGSTPAFGDGWFSSPDRPGKFRKTALARAPAAVMAVQACGETAP